MTAALQTLVNEPQLARAVAARGRKTVLARHTCAHRVDELLDIVAQLDGGRAGARVAEASA